MGQPFLCDAAQVPDVDHGGSPLDDGRVAHGLPRSRTPKGQPHTNLMTNVLPGAGTLGLGRSCRANHPVDGLMTDHGEQDHTLVPEMQAGRSKIAAKPVSEVLMMSWACCRVGPALPGAGTLVLGRGCHTNHPWAVDGWMTADVPLMSWACCVGLAAAAVLAPLALLSLDERFLYLALQS